MTLQSRDYPIQPIPFTQVAVGDGFWQARIHTAINDTIPYNFEKCEETGRVDNFDKAAGLMDGAHEGLVFNDSDVFKVIEGAAYGLQITPNPELETYIDSLIDKIAAAQEQDGYIYTARTIDPDNVPERCGRERWSYLFHNHELYNLGHMYEAAVAWFQATGKRNFLDIALKSAALVDSVFGADKLRDIPGHQEIEIGLVRLYRVTGDDKYLNLAKYFLDERGYANGRALYGPYCQDHQPATQQREAVGHAVRAGYMYAGMTDIAALTGDVGYYDAVRGLWENVVGKKLALTGGIGARHQGEAFGDNYELPNLSAYNETCAAQANILWNHRMFLLTGEAKYFDILERSLYNGFLSGVGMDGRSFFYVNPLSCDGEFHFNRDDSIARQPWFSCSCCPTNVVRLLPALAGYVYALRDQALFINLFASGRAKLQIDNTEVVIEQTTRYPWEGEIGIALTVAQPAEFALKLRIPSFAQGNPLPSDLYRYLAAETEPVCLSIDGEDIPVNVSDGYATVARRWSGTTRITLTLPMALNRVVAHPAVTELSGMVALERGPIVYALESGDNAAPLFDLTLADSAALRAAHHPDLLGGITVIEGEALDAARNPLRFKAIPYYAWGHREAGQMTVWLQRA